MKKKSSTSSVIRNWAVKISEVPLLWRVYLIQICHFHYILNSLFVTCLPTLKVQELASCRTQELGYKGQHVSLLFTVAIYLANGLFQLNVHILHWVNF